MSVRVKIGICSLMGLGVLSVTVPQSVQSRWLLTYLLEKYWGSLHCPNDPQLAEPKR